MIAMYRRTFITKILFDILSNIIFAKIEIRQLTTDIPHIQLCYNIMYNKFVNF